MASTRTTISCTVKPDVRAAIEAAAASERRPIAHWMELAIEKVLIERQFLRNSQPLAKAPLPVRKSGV